MKPFERRKIPLAKIKLKKGTTKRLFYYIVKDYKLPVFLVVVCILISSIANVAGSLFIKILIDNYIAPLIKLKNPEFNGLLKAIYIMFSIYMTGVIATFAYNRIMIIVAQGTLKNIRDEMFSHMQRLPIRYFDRHSHGDVMSRYTNDTDTLRQMIVQSLPQMVSSITTILLVVYAMITSSIYLTIIAFSTVFLMIFITKKIGGKSSVFFIKQQETLGETNGYIEEMINGQKVIKVFSYEEDSKRKFDKLNEKLCYNSTEANIFANILMPIMGNISNLQYVLIAISGGVLAINNIGGVTLGIIASFLQLSKTFSMPIAQLSQQLNSVIMALAGAERIFELLDQDVEIDNGYVSLVNAKFDENNNLMETEERTGIWAWKHPHLDGTLTYTQVKGDVRFHGVKFGYFSGKEILSDFGLYAEPGQKVALVGATGAGKTTITNLINRFYDVTEGKIRYDGINIQKIKKEDLRRSLGIVLQDTNLFTGTVMENIRYGKLNATDEEVYLAAKLANAHNFILKLPHGYDTILNGNGEGLSQGQRQLISIARAAVADPPVMILDEATSSIDTRTETIIQKGMDSLMKGRTVFVIAHRLSTVQNSDVIIVLEMGKIIERGSHEKLLNDKGKYYELYTGKFELS